MCRTERKWGYARSRCGAAVFASLMLVRAAQATAQRVPLQASAANLDPGIQNVAVHNNIFREIVDASSGVRWVMLRDVGHPAGPGRLLLAKPEDELRASGHAAEKRVSLPAAVTPCVHVGDRVVVEEHTAMADVHLEAVAMEPAVSGSTFRVRLKMGGKVARAVAVAPGKAELAVAGGMAR